MCGLIGLISFVLNGFGDRWPMEQKVPRDIAWVSSLGDRGTLSQTLAWLFPHFVLLKCHILREAFLYTLLRTMP